MINRELKRQRLVMKYAQKREHLKKQIEETSSLKEKLMLHRKLQELPRNSSRVRLHNRCLVTGRPKGYSRDFGLSRHVYEKCSWVYYQVFKIKLVRLTLHIFDTLYYTPQLLAEVNNRRSEASMHRCFDARYEKGYAQC
jgi:small subunit ribosomal protein S14